MRYFLLSKTGFVKSSDGDNERKKRKEKETYMFCHWRECELIIFIMTMMQDKELCLHFGSWAPTARRGGGGGEGI